MDERHIIAIHESGHAIVSIAVGKPAAMLCLTEGGGGRFYERPPESWEPKPEHRAQFYRAVIASYGPRDQPEVLTLLMISFGGILAQRRFCGSAAAAFEYFGEHDRKQREDLSRAVTESTDEARAFLNSAQAETAMIIDSRWQQVVALAGELALRGKLDADDIRGILENGPAARRRRHWEQLTARAQLSGMTLVPRGV
jgi:hypothetical protein